MLRSLSRVRLPQSISPALRLNNRAIFFRGFSIESSEGSGRTSLSDGPVLIDQSIKELSKACKEENYETVIDVWAKIASSEGITPQHLKQVIFECLPNGVVYVARCAEQLMAEKQFNIDRQLYITLLLLYAQSDKRRFIELLEKTTPDQLQLSRQTRYNIDVKLLHNVDTKSLKKWDRFILSEYNRPELKDLKSSTQSEVHDLLEHQLRTEDIPSFVETLCHLENKIERDFYVRALLGRGVGNSSIIRQINSLMIGRMELLPKTVSAIAVAVSQDAVSHTKVWEKASTYHIASLGTRTLSAVKSGREEEIRECAELLRENPRVPLALEASAALRDHYARKITEKIRVSSLKHGGLSERVEEEIRKIMPERNRVIFESIKSPESVSEKHLLGFLPDPAPSRRKVPARTMTAESRSRGFAQRMEQLQRAEAARHSLKEEKPISIEDK
ncbi:hypothetical protein PROFUN_10179 [Planoprotostelium fungivorum]|uniref:Uncharacterized protein n=1 Tax=Planoprotostelium fungivorum TaxID=1890364 RepID=A0A2P6NEL5_9EUKA|nr:hypothetical protein PROFUN_10179 [Planoprotostelium fungivorum]